MSLKRKSSELLRLLRQRSLRLLLFVGFLFVLISGLTYLQDQNRNKWTDNSNRVDSIQLEVNAWENEGLAGGIDPNTVFRDGILGNFEPKTPEVPSNQPEDLPTVSVVIVFHNEGWTPLLRTVHSVLLRSPSQFIKEIVMVDDYSNKEHLKEKLEKYLKRFSGKVGLIHIVVFFSMTNFNNFSGIFEWGLLYKETAISQKEKESRSHSSMPFRSPTHAGGLFAIDRKWFAELGYYDDGLQIWGGEQYELSFKCKSFKWFTLFIHYCFLYIYIYSLNVSYFFKFQLLRLNKEGQLAQGEWCLTPQGNKVHANHCTKGTVDGPWAYEEVS
uniref:Glyco_trans_2-like domain-containing protein n=1 Tax=Heterorhabditis bacteriophora TaxID=37862 RepID=A0A1I7X0K0_HETBA